VLFKIMGILIKLAPLGVLGAIAFTVGKYGIGSLKQLGMLVALFYAAVAIFVVVVLGAIMRLCGSQHLQAAALPARGADDRARHDVLDSVLPQIMAKLKRMGIRDSTVGLVIPPATRSTSTRSRSTSRWPRCSSPRRPTRRSRCRTC
jgi:aerobic C4-dicarboxylate transport protein